MPGGSCARTLIKLPVFTGIPQKITRGRPDTRDGSSGLVRVAICLLSSYLFVYLVCPVRASLGAPQLLRFMLLSSLARHGYAVVQPRREATATLHKALVAWEKCGTFRYPLVEPICSPTERVLSFGGEARSCFNALFGICRDCMNQLDRDWVAAEGTPLGVPLDDLPSDDVHLPGYALPFQGVPVTSFHETFFNCFNYNHGSLNSHVDRGLLTVVYGFGGGDADNDAPHARLWLRDTATEQWIDGGACVRQASGSVQTCGGVLLLAGERLEMLTAGKVKAIEHCARVDPRGDTIEFSHSTRDPAARETGNRLSAAMIFSCAEVDGR